MQRLETWLAARPTGQEIDQAINDLERKLQLLRAIKELGGQGNGGAHAPGNGANGNGNGREVEFDPTRISHERRQIIEVMLATPNVSLTPAAVQSKLRGRGIQTDVKAIQTNMSRMARFNLLARPRQGRYRVPPNVADYIKRDEVVRT